MKSTTSIGAYFSSLPWSYENRIRGAYVVSKLFFWAAVRVPPTICGAGCEPLIFSAPVARIVIVGPFGACVGDWVLVHVGFAMSRIDAVEAAETLKILTELGEMQAELESMRESEAALAAE